VQVPNINRTSGTGYNPPLSADVTQMYFVGRVSAKRVTRRSPAANPTYEFDATCATFSTQLANNATLRNISYQADTMTAKSNAYFRFPDPHWASA